jgi:hypothetical protein
MALTFRHRSLLWSFLHAMRPFSIWHVPVGLCSYSSVMLACHYKSLRVSAGPFPTCGTLVYMWDCSPSRPTYGTLHVYMLDRPPSPFDLWDPKAHGTPSASTCGTLHVYMWDRPLSSSDLWDLKALSIWPVGPKPWDPSRVHVGLSSISIWPVVSECLRVTCICGTILTMGPNGSPVTCSCGTSYAVGI